VRCDASTYFVVQWFHFSIAYEHPDVARKKVGEHNTQLLKWRWPGDDELILPMVTSIINSTIASIVNAAIAGLPDPSRTIQQLWGYQEEPNDDGGPNASNGTPIFDNNTAARWVKVAIKSSNPTISCIVHGGQQPDCTAGAQTPMRGCHS
jgi:hypothetical protein